MPQPQTCLNTLINQSGKMRMLSHRMAMCALVANLERANTSEAMKTFETALREFEDTFRLLTKGSGSELDDATAKLISDADIPNRRDAEIVSSFLARAQTLLSAIMSDRQSDTALIEFANYVATPLLGALNAITTGVAALADAQAAKAQDAESQSRVMLASAAHSIGKVSRSVKLISVNATIEAARAGESGAGFGVIAQEIGRLSQEANQYSEQLIRHLSDPVSPPSA